MKPCEICGKTERRIHCVIFVPYDDIQTIGMPMGHSLFACEECNMGYLAQYMEMTNKEISEWLKWIAKEV